MCVQKGWESAVVRKEPVTKDSETSGASFLQPIRLVLPAFDW